MKTQLEFAGSGTVTPQIEGVARAEGISSEYVRRMTAEGKIVIPGNRRRNPRAVGIGKGLATKVNASIGTSSDI
ncbi:MAG TPA: phosphomethylpyrimidine synthase ThiC, partial [Verrucomicrobiae bacterium]|nr:phosphomethylpyrimidine synthase ThiC [Verrucomicrobiae bacterium]